MKNRIASRVRFLLLLSVAAPALGQGRATEGRGGEDTAVTVACCLCVDGSSRTSSFETGTARWRVTRPGGQSAETAIIVGSPQGAWASLSPARWISPVGLPSARGDYVYDLTFYLPGCMIRPVVAISGDFAGDNRATVYLDGQQIAVSNGPPNMGFRQSNVTSFTGSISSPGPHLLRIVVYNEESHTGLLVRGRMNMVCPRDPFL